MIEIAGSQEAKSFELRAATSLARLCDLSEVDIRKTTEIVRRLSDETKDASRQSQGLRQQMDTRKRSHARACR